MSAYIRFAASFAALLSLTGCSASGDESTDSADSDLVDKETPDVLTVTAKLQEPIRGHGESGFSDSECTAIDGPFMECTAAMESLAASAAARLTVCTCMTEQKNSDVPMWIV